MIKDKFIKLIKFIKRHKYSTIIILVALIISGVLVWDSIKTSLPFDIPQLNVQKKKEEQKVRAPLSGIYVIEEKAKRRPFAVVIDNHTSARPQSGLGEASLVFETYAEGGITRLLAIFQENDVGEIGPVRSARVEFVNWAKELEAVFGHVGGSADALSLINKINVLDFNQFYNSSYFKRDNFRPAPHNVYTSTEKIREGAVKLNYSKEKSIKEFNFKEDIKKEERIDTSEISVPFSGNLYAVKYSYDKEKNSYKRFVGGVAHLDRNTKEQILAKNIIIQYTNIKDRSGLDTQVSAIGSGKIEYYLDGKKYEGSWEKTSASSRTKYLNLSKEEIELNAGTTWIEVVR